MRVIEAAALLHDVARSEADHANRGAELLTVTGYPRIATVVRRHMDVLPADATDIGEAQVVFLADKVVMGTEVVSLQERLVAVESRFAGDQRALAGARRRLEIARDLTRRVEGVVGRPLGTIVGRRDATVG